MSTDTIATLKGRSLNKTGVTERLARSYASQLGVEHIAIVRYSGDSLITDADGQQKVVLAIDAFEPVVDPSDDGAITDMIRNLEAALYRNRAQADGQATIDEELDGPAPTVNQVLASGRALIEEDDEGPKLWNGDTDVPSEEADEAEEASYAAEADAEAGSDTDGASEQPDEQPDEPTELDEEPAQPPAYDDPFNPAPTQAE